jgi:hypothetical protein
MDHGAGILDTHPVSSAVVLHDIHDRFIGVAVLPIAIALVLCVSNALFGVTYCTDRGGTFEKSEPSPSAIVGCAKIASRNTVYGSRPTIAV